MELRNGSRAARSLLQDFVPSHFSFLLRAPSVPVYENPLHDWLPNKSWAR